MSVTVEPLATLPVTSRTEHSLRFPNVKAGYRTPTCPREFATLLGAAAEAQVATEGERCSSLVEARLPRR